MNWQTEEIIRRIKSLVADEGVFSADQIILLQGVVDGLAEAIDMEATSAGGSGQGRGHGWG